MKVKNSLGMMNEPTQNTCMTIAVSDFPTTCNTSNTFFATSTFKLAQIGNSPGTGLSSASLITVNPIVQKPIIVLPYGNAHSLNLPNMTYVQASQPNIISSAQSIAPHFLPPNTFISGPNDMGNTMEILSNKSISDSNCQNFLFNSLPTSTVVTSFPLKPSNISEVVQHSQQHPFQVFPLQNNSAFVTASELPLPVANLTLLQSKSVSHANTSVSAKSTLTDSTIQPVISQASSITVSPGLETNVGSIRNQSVPVFESSASKRAKISLPASSLDASTKFAPQSIDVKTCSTIKRARGRPRKQKKQISPNYVSSIQSTIDRVLSSTRSKDDGLTQGNTDDCEKKTSQKLVGKSICTPDHDSNYRGFTPCATPDHITSAFGAPEVSSLYKIQYDDTGSSPIHVDESSIMKITFIRKRNGRFAIKTPPTKIKLPAKKSKHIKISSNLQNTFEEEVDVKLKYLPTVVIKRLSKADTKSLQVKNATRNVSPIKLPQSPPKLRSKCRRAVLHSEPVKSSFVKRILSSSGVHSSCSDDMPVNIRPKVKNLKLENESLIKH